MSKVIAVVACGLSVAACSASIPDFLKSSPPKAALRFESVPTGAEVKVFRAELSHASNAPATGWSYGEVK